MIILGINDGQDASAALIRAGKLVSFSRESRHRRNLNYSGFPRRAVRQLLNDANLQPGQVDYVAFAGHTMKAPRTQREYLEQFSENPRIGRVAKTALSYVLPGAFRGELRKRERMAQLLRVKIPTQKALFVDSHLAAAMLAYLSGFSALERPALILVVGGGDRRSASVHVAQAGKLERIASILEEDSLGNLLEHVTYLLGMVPQRDERLLMDLGSYASGPQVESVRKRFELLFEFDQMLPLNWRRASNLPDTARCQDFLRGHLRRRRFDHIAGGWYRFLCHFIGQWVERCVKKTEISDVVVCGSLFELGSLLPALSSQQKIRSLNKSILPGMAGNAIGAGLLVASEKEKSFVFKQQSSSYWGDTHNSSIYSSALESFKDRPDIIVEKPENLAARATELLMLGGILARISGPEDINLLGFGNRSLMARADYLPAREKLRTIMNVDDFWARQAIFWQAENLRAFFHEAELLPEAPDGEFYLTPRTPNPWYGLRQGERVPVQAINRRNNKAFWELLQAYHKQAGRVPLLAGSWRDKRGHLMKTIKDALELWEEQELEILILGPWLVYRKELV